MSSDRISELPEEVVSIILSLMPTIYAVRTSVLSKRWKYSWMYVNNLNFEDVTLSTKFKYVDGALKHCKSSQINLFLLHISVHPVPASSVSSWINEAIKLKVNELDIKVYELGLPLSMLSCKTLTKLTLKYHFFDGHVWEFPCHVNLPCLKTLDVCICSDPVANAFKLIGGCPVLEILSLEVRRWEQEDEGDYILNIPTLKRLKLRWVCLSNCVNKVVLNVPNLEHLFVRGYLLSQFVMEDISSLVELQTFDIFLKNMLTPPLPIFPNLNHLELKELWDSSQIPQFIYCCPELKHLCIEKQLKPYYLKFKRCNWVEPKFVPASMRTKLSTIKFSVCQWWKDDLPFLKYMLGNTEVLKTVTISSETLRIKEQMQLREELLKFPRASTFCEIHFHDN